MNEMQATLMEILVDVDKVLTDKGLKYSLMYGTALGAVRHGGYIPWDDDVDIIVCREDRDRIMEVLEKELPQGKYTIVAPYTLDWNLILYKVRMNNTTLIEESHMNTRTHQGAFIDIFVAEKYPRSKFRRALYYPLMRLLRRFMQVANTTRGKPRQDWFQFSCYYVMKKIELLLDMIPEEDTPYRHIRSGDDQVFIYPPNVLDKIKDIEYEGVKLKMVEDYDSFLRLFYGEYMELPPEEDRVPHHAIAFSSTMDYKEWLLKNKQGEQP